MKKKNFCKAQTFILALLVLELCFYYTVIREQVISLTIPDHPTLYKTNDVYFFDLAFTITTSVTTICTVILVIMIGLKSLPLRKSFLIFTMALNFCFGLPVYISGIYIWYWNDDFVTNDLVKDAFQNFNGSEFVRLEQEKFCCCDLSQSVTVDRMDNSTRSLDFLNFCPIEKCYEDVFEACDDNIKNMFRRKILIFSIIGLVSSTIFIFLSPFLYSQFEKDRRLMRAMYIRKWRDALKKRVTGPDSLITDEKSPLLPLSSRKDASTQKSSHKSENK